MHKNVISPPKKNGWLRLLRGDWGEKERTSLPRTEDGGADNRHDPMHAAVRGPAEHEDADGHDGGARNRRRQAVLRLAPPGLAAGALAVAHEAAVVAKPERVGHGGGDHAGEDAEEGEADL